MIAALFCRMTRNKKIPLQEGLFFITITCYRWLPLFSLTNGYNLVYKWFDFLVANGNEINAYVIMPNHLHGIFYLKSSNYSINTLIGQGKRIVGRQLVDRLKVLDQENIIRILKRGVNKSDQKRGKIHEIWEGTFDWKHCFSKKFTLQKLNYIHANPCKGKWNLAKDITEYPHSSAKYYYTGVHASYPVSDLFERMPIIFGS